MLLEISIIGHVGQDAIVKEFNGKKTIQFTVAHSRKYKNAAGQEVQSTTWVRCSSFRERDNLSKYILKGTMVYVRGSLNVGVYQQQASGQWVPSVDCLVSEIKLLSKPQEATVAPIAPTQTYTPAEPYNAAAGNASYPNATQPEQTDFTILPDTDLPF